MAQAFADARNVLDADEARNRVRCAVERTVPVEMLARTLIISLQRFLMSGGAAGLRGASLNCSGFVRSCY
jgi:hypothetical protein